MADTLYKGGGVGNLRRIFPDDPSVTVERPLFDSIAQEPARLSGTPIRIYSVRRAKSRNPWYGEPSMDKQEWGFQGPWEVWGEVDYNPADNVSPEATSDGLKSVSDAIVEVARKEFEDAGAPFPKIGDVVEFWEEVEYAAEQNKYWDVVKATPTGTINSTPVYVMWKIELKSNSKFDPKRKVEGERV